MTVEDGNKRRRNKILVLFILVCVTLVGYYLVTYSRENANLIKKEINLDIQLKKYAAAYSKCDRNLQTSKGDALNFHESNKQLQARVVKQEKDIAELDKNNGETSEKLEHAYRFFLDVKDMLLDDQSISEDKNILPETVVVLKQQIETLKLESAELVKLRESHVETTKTLDVLKADHGDLMTRSTALKAYIKKLATNNKLLKKSLDDQSATLEMKIQQASQLEDTVRKLEHRITAEHKKTVSHPAPEAPEVGNQLEINNSRPPVKTVKATEPVEPQISLSAKPVETYGNDVAEASQTKKIDDVTENQTSERRLVVEDDIPKNKATNPATDLVEDIATNADTKPAVSVPTTSIAANEEGEIVGGNQITKKEETVANPVVHGAGDDGTEEGDFDENEEEEDDDML